MFAMGVALRLAQYVPALAFCVSCARAGTVLSWTMMIFAEHRDDDYLFCERYHTTSTTCTTWHPPQLPFFSFQILTLPPML